MKLPFESVCLIPTLYGRPRGPRGRAAGSVYVVLWPSDVSGVACPPTQMTIVSSTGGGAANVAWTTTALCDAAVTTSAGLFGPGGDADRCRGGRGVVSLR